MTLDALRVAYITPDETRLMLTLTLDNPNDRAVMVDALDFTLTVGGAAVASAVLTRPLALPAHGEAQAEIGEIEDLSPAIGSAIGLDQNGERVRRDARLPEHGFEAG